MGSRNRHGRGLRGALLPSTVPGHTTARENFDALVVAAAERLARRWSRHWGDVEFATEDTPPSLPSPPQQRIALAQTFPSEPGLPTRIVVYRRPIEDRARDEQEKAALVRGVVVRQVAELMRMDPRDIDPDAERSS